MQSPKEQFLLFRIRMHKDQEAFRTIYDQYVSSMHRFLRSKLPTEQDADDATSTTFLRLWNYLITTQVDHLSGILFTIARGVIAEFYRSEKASISLEAAVQEGKEPIARESGELIQAQSEVALVRQALDALPDEQRAVLLWKYFDKLSMAEIAHRLQKTTGATRVMAHRATKLFREFFTRHRSA